MVDYIKIAVDVVNEVTDLASQRQTDQVNDAFASMDGIVLQDISIDNTGVDIWHHLGMRWSSFEVLKQDNNASIYSTGTETDPTKAINLKSNNAVVATIRVR